MNDYLSELVELDRRGFILPPETDPEDHIDGSRRTLEWAGAVRQELDKRGAAEVMGVEFRADQLLSADSMRTCLAPATRAYGVEPDWVPAFYSNEFLPWYVGGASFYGMAEGAFKVCFVLREVFRERERWLLYNRTEIAAHETCQVARAGFNQLQFEEPCAYAISRSALRRVLGGMFTRGWESLAFLGSSLLLIAGSVADMLGGPSWVRMASGVPLALTGTGLAVRSMLNVRTLRCAQRFLATTYGSLAPAITFRCTDEEVRSLAALKSGDVSPGEWIDQQPRTPRWEIIRRRFISED